MKSPKCIQLILIIFLGINGTTFAVDRSDFHLKAPIKGDMKPGTPIRLALSDKVIAETSKGFSDLRLFDDLGRETPYVIYLERRTKQTPRSFTWKVMNYNNNHHIQTIILERPGITDAALDVGLITTARDFNKAVEIHAGDDLASWKFIAAGVLFDFSSHIALRRTTLKIPETDARYLKVMLKDNMMTSQHEEKMSLRYKELEFSLSGQKTGEIKIDRFTSRISQKSPVKLRLDQVIISSPRTSIDREGNTIVALGYLNLPVERMLLRIKNRYYYRPVELWVGKTAEKKSFTLAANDTIYRIPDINEERNTLFFSMKSYGHMMLKIINHDNPPLQVEEVRIQWIRRNLYFIPEKDRGYELYLGGRNIRSPQYDLQRLIPDKYNKLMTYVECKLGALKKNDAYSPRPDPQSQAGIKKYLFPGLVILLACILGFWVFRLMVKIPANRSR
ncbi:MAG: DUF3999 family protein [Thermodesulfobacteriota bacterium]|nr:DUF3999 family protein [Thermodesulfobacteriota bacterium]